MLKYFLEVRNRFVLVLLSWITVLISCYAYKETLLFLLVQPNMVISSFASFYFIFTDVTEVFTVYMNLIFFLGNQILLLYFIYHFFIFFSPALFNVEYIIIRNLFYFSFIIWLISIFIAKNLFIPLSWEFFSSFHTLFSLRFMDLHFEAKLGEYLNFCIFLYYLCIFYFELFAMLFYLFNVVYNNYIFLKKFRKLYYYVFLLFSTILSPPDIFSQILITIFSICIYECFVFCYIVRCLF
jgi:sec-independent protein translocase protein TatC